jgi:hypothetical protein
MRRSGSRHSVLRFGQTLALTCFLSLLILAFGGCGEFRESFGSFDSGGSTKRDGGSDRANFEPVRVEVHLPSSEKLPLFTQSKGRPPFQYAIISGSGLIENDVLTPTGPGLITVVVKDTSGNFTFINSFFYDPMTLTLMPSTPTIGFMETVQVVVKGGIPPFKYALLKSPRPLGGRAEPPPDLRLDPATGVLTSGTTEGSALIEVHDSAGNKAQMDIIVLSRTPGSPPPGGTPGPGDGSSKPSKPSKPDHPPEPTPTPTPMPSPTPTPTPAPWPTATPTPTPSPTPSPTPGHHDTSRGPSPFPPPGIFPETFSEVSLSSGILNLREPGIRILDARAMTEGPYRDHVWVLVESSLQKRTANGSASPLVSRLRLYRLHPNTDPDETFGPGGFVDLHLENHFGQQAFLPLVDGRVLIIGHPAPELGSSGPHALAQLLRPDGRPDPTFGQSGRAYVPFAPATKHGITLEHGFLGAKILVRGTSVDARKRHPSIERQNVYRLNLDGTLE